MVGVMFVVFFVLWVIFNGNLTWEIAAFGVGVSGLMYWFVCRFMGYSFQKEWKAVRNMARGLGFIGCLIWEIVKANVNVMRLILSPKFVNEPVLVRFKTKLKSDAARVALANSITLTPGTITVTLEGDEFLVHCLDREMADGLEDSVFEQWLRKME